jgi:hypothetical protein
VGNWRGRCPGGKAAHDEFGAILSDIRRFGKTTPNDRKRLRDLACTFGWNECSIDSDIITVEDPHQSDQELKALA